MKNFGGSSYLLLSCCAVAITMQTRFPVLLASTPDANQRPTDVEQPQQAPSSKQLQQIQQKTHHHRRPPMSCYVCTTMDYENPADNLCRSMKHQRAQIVHQQHSLNFASTTTQTTTTTTTTESSATSAAQQTMPSQMPLLMTTSPASVWPLESGTEESNLVNASNSQQQQLHLAETDGLGSHHQAAPNQVGLARHYQHSHRPLPPANSIRTRPCLDGENFCSIVSIVRIEFANDQVVTKFWAIERNCSRSCNTGCMLIGERVRLRVCSQCCRTPNCNIGSNAHKIFAAQLKLNQRLLLGLSLVVSQLLLCSFQDSNGQRWGTNSI